MYIQVYGYANEELKSNAPRMLGINKFTLDSYQNMSYSTVKTSIQCFDYSSRLIHFLMCTF